MNGKLSNSSELSTDFVLPEKEPEMEMEHLADYILKELLAQTQSKSTGNTIEPKSLQLVVKRMATEVARICRSSARIQKSGNVRTWQLNLARHRISKCLKYYQLGAKQARTELFSTLGAIAYRYVAPMRSPMGFQQRSNLLEDFLQNFYIESLAAFRRENHTATNYTPRTPLEIAEYMAFTEQYARRRIVLKNGSTQQLIVLRSQGFARRLPAETTLDIELAAESSKSEESDFARSAAMQQVRASMMSETVDPTDGFLRERVIEELVEYLESIGQSDCIDYLILKLQDFSAPEIDEILGLEARQRDYLQQRFKYHVEKFSKSHHWELVHQWLDVGLDNNLGLNEKQWNEFLQQLNAGQKQLLQLKQNQASENAIASMLKMTPKQVQKRWFGLLELAWQFRNGTIKLNPNRSQKAG